MKQLISLLFALLVSWVCIAQLKVEHGLTENKSNPLGVDVVIPRFTWQLNSDKENTMQQGFELQVFQGKKIIWGSGRVSSDQSALVEYGGPKLSSHTSYQWRVRVWDNQGRVSEWSPSYSFHTAFYSPEDWKAQWIGFGAEEVKSKRAVQYYRTEINVAKKVTKAIAYITSQGMYEAQLNGKRIGDMYLTPGWTSYKTRLQYQVYDVTAMLNVGKNVVGAMLGNGWFRGTLGWTNNTNIYGDQLALLFQMHVEYADGSKVVFTTDQNWKSGYGAIPSSEIYDGEEIDARLHQRGWAEVGFDDSKWNQVRVLNQGYAHLLAMYNEPIRKHETFSNPKYIVTPKGEKVLDFGQNLVGWVKVNASGKAGDSIVIKHAEVLDKAGNFYTENMRAAKTTAKYILSGKGTEEFEPHFTFYGFRYIKVEGLQGDLDPSQFTAVTLYSDMEATGTFSTSNSLINQLQHNIQWGQRGNFLDVPTDCPQRDERLGWTGDAQAFSRTATFNFRTHSFFAKWLRDLEADQLPSGSVPHVIPNVLGKTAAGSAGWADVATIIPWDMYLVYGDKRILETQFNSMKNWVRFMEENSKNDLWNVGFHFGDWLFYRPFDDNDGRAAVTDKYLIAQCFYAHSTQLLINAAEVLGKKEELEYHRNRLKKIKDAFMREYVTPAGRLVSGTQTAYVLALNFDMLPEPLRMPTADRLVENIRSYGNHLSTGFLGTPYLCEVLTRFGKTDMAFKLLMQETFPSWLYPVKMGATTIWERWSGIRPDGSFEPAGMNSFNHYAYGAIGDWMYRRVAGIDNAPGSVGYKKIKIEPNIGGELTQATAVYKTYYGEIESTWNLDGKRLGMRVRIPANTSASIHIPSLQNIRLNGQSLDQAIVLSKSTSGDKTVVELGSGTYEIVADMR